MLVYCPYGLVFLFQSFLLNYLYQLKYSIKYLLLKSKSSITVYVKNSVPIARYFVLLHIAKGFDDANQSHQSVSNSHYMGCFAPLGKISVQDTYRSTQHGTPMDNQYPSRKVRIGKGFPRHFGQNHFEKSTC